MIAVAVAALAGLDGADAVALARRRLRRRSARCSAPASRRRSSARLPRWPLSLAGSRQPVVAAIVGAVRVSCISVCGWDRADRLLRRHPRRALLCHRARRADTRRHPRDRGRRRASASSCWSRRSPRWCRSSSAVAPPACARRGACCRSPSCSLAAPSAALVFARLRVPAGRLTGALLVSGVPTAPAGQRRVCRSRCSIAAYVVLGAMIGSRFAGTDARLHAQRSFARLGRRLRHRHRRRRLAGASLAAWLTGQPFSQVLVAFAPGGLDAMTGLALRAQSRLRPSSPRTSWRASSPSRSSRRWSCAAMVLGPERGA